MGSGQDSPSRITLSHSLIGWARRLVFISMISIFDADEGILAPFFKILYLTFSFSLSLLCRIVVFSSSSPSFPYDFDFSCVAYILLGH